MSCHFHIMRRRKAIEDKKVAEVKVEHVEKKPEPKRKGRVKKDGE